VRSDWRADQPLYGGGDTDPELPSSIGPFQLERAYQRWRIIGPHGSAQWLQANSHIAAVHDLVTEYGDWKTNVSSRRVYFIGPHLRNGYPVKIGVARDPRERMKSFQTGHPERLHLHAVAYGDNQYEKLLHAKFARYKIENGANREWFVLKGALLKLVAELSTHLDSYLAEIDEQRPTKNALDRLLLNPWDSVLSPNQANTPDGQV
jgi:hypothetical protein